MMKSIKCFLELKKPYKPKVIAVVQIAYFS